MKVVVWNSGGQTGDTQKSVFKARLHLILSENIIVRQSLPASWAAPTGTPGKLIGRTLRAK